MKENYSEEISQIIRSKQSPQVIREKLLDYHENDIAAALDVMTPPGEKAYLPHFKCRGAFRYF